MYDDIFYIEDFNKEFEGTHNTDLNDNDSFNCIINVSNFQEGKKQYLIIRCKLQLRKALHNNRKKHLLIHLSQS